MGDTLASIVEKTAAGSFVETPAAWYYLGSMAELARGPVRFTLPGSQDFVGYRTQSGRPVVLAGRCAHMGADLSIGCVTGERISCPLHGWEFGPSGACEHIPATDSIPGFARQQSFPVEERGGHVFFFNRPQSRFPLPFFEGIPPDQLLAAPVLEFVVDAPWHLVSANGFDAQHYRCAHDRTVDGELVMDSPDFFAKRLRANFKVTGDSFHDHIVRALSGRDVHMTVTNWGGNLILVAAKFRRTTSYGIISFVPLSGGRTRLRNLVWVPRRRGIAALLDPLDVRVRRLFIRRFVQSDVDRSHGIHFNPHRTIPADKELVEYLDWLQELHR